MYLHEALLLCAALSNQCGLPVRFYFSKRIQLRYKQSHDTSLMKQWHPPTPKSRVLISLSQMPWKEKLCSGCLTIVSMEEKSNGSSTQSLFSPGFSGKEILSIHRQLERGPCLLLGFRVTLLFLSSCAIRSPLIYSNPLNERSLKCSVPNSPALFL